MLLDTKVKAIVFDCFGVIVPDLGKELIEKSKLTQPAKNEISRLKMEADRGLITEERLSKLYSAATGRTFSTKARLLMHKKHLNKDLLKLIDSLKDKYKTAMLSNINKEYMDLLSKQCQLTRYFDLILTSSEVGYVKPEPQIFEALVHQLKLDFSAIVFIDDQPANIETVKQLGMRGFLYTDIKQLKIEFKSIGIGQPEAENQKKQPAPLDGIKVVK